MATERSEETGNESAAPAGHHAGAPVPWELSLQLLGAMVVVLLLGLIVAPPEDPLATFHHGRLATNVSAILLAMAGALATASYLLQPPVRVRRLFWLACACTFTFLALDELMQFHVRLEEWLTGAQLARPDSLPRWNGVIVCGYGAMALLFCALALPEIRRHRAVAAHLALGLLFFSIHLTADLLFPAALVREFVQELSKVLANASFAIAMLGGLLSVAAAHRALHPAAAEAEAAADEPHLAATR